jgi:diguanylate cyclase (GGDEF)-like protein
VHRNFALDIPAYGVVGSSWATSFARLYLMLVLVVAVLMLDRKHRYGLVAVSRRIEWQHLRKLFLLGAPAGASIFVEIAIFALVTALCATFGRLSLAGHEVALQCASTTFMVPFAISAATSVRVGHAIGRMKTGAATAANVIAAGWSGIAAGAGFMLCASAVLLAFPRPIAHIFTPDPGIIAAAVPLLAIAAGFQFFDGIQINAAGALRGAGDTATSFYTQVVCYWIVGMPLGLESVRDAVGAIIDFRFAFVNQPGARLLSTSKEELQGRLLCENYPVNRTDGFFERYKHVVETGESLAEEFPINADRINASWLSYQVVRLEDGVAITTTDISAFKANERRLLHIAQHDALTGLAGRRVFEERLETSLRQARSGGRTVGVMVLDCDNFKRVNDLMGHHAGDALLIQFAARLKACAGGNDTVARVGGDEFMVVLDDLRAPAEATTIATQVLARLQEPMVVEGHSVAMTASIGVCVYPGDLECATTQAGGDCAAALLRNADAAMYRAKAEGRNRVKTFTSEMANSLARRRQVDTQMQQAIQAEELSLVYQPRVDLLTGLVTGVEALLRWRNPELGLVMPGEFIPLAEDNGMIVPIGRWVVDQACREMQQLALTMGRLVPFAVNVSPRQFQQETLAQEIVEALATHRIDPRALELEITESLLLQESPRFRANIDEVRAQGISIAIDDFGTGYSSMSYLTRLQVDRIKIDQSFVRRLNQDEQNEAICKAIVGLGKALNIAVVAEGVETVQHRDQLRGLGCDEAQGHFYARPVTLLDLPQTLRAIEFGELSYAAA